MLKDNERTLIASGVDGPLDGAVAVQFRHLIANDPEANRFYRALLSDRDRLANLPKFPAPHSIAQTINQRIYPQPVLLAVRPSGKRNSPTWLPYALAASVFLALSAGSFLVFQHKSDQEIIAERTGRVALPGVHLLLPGTGGALASAANREELPDPNVEQLPHPSNPAVANRSNNPQQHPEVLPPANPNEWLTARVAGEIPNLQSVSARLPLLFNVMEASQAETKKRLVEEYFATTAVRLDLFVRDVPQALDVFQVAAKSSGLGTVVVPLTGEQVKRKFPVSLAVFTDSLSANDHVNFLVKLAEADATVQTFAQGHLLSASPTDVKDFKWYFGVDLGAGKRSNANEANEPSVASSTLGQVKQAIGKDTPKSAIVTTYGPAAARTNANFVPEIKAYFEKRGDRPASAIPALIVIRHVSEK
jgi:hypothetical protein